MFLNEQFFDILKASKGYEVTLGNKDTVRNNLRIDLEKIAKLNKMATFDYNSRKTWGDRGDGYLCLTGDPLPVYRILISCNSNKYPCGAFVNEVIQQYEDNDAVVAFVVDGSGLLSKMPRELDISHKDFKTFYDLGGLSRGPMHSKCELKHRSHFYTYDLFNFLKKVLGSDHIRNNFYVHNSAVSKFKFKSTGYGFRVEELFIFPAVEKGVILETDFLGNLGDGTLLDLWNESVVDIPKIDNLLDLQLSEPIKKPKSVWKPARVTFPEPTWLTTVDQGFNDPVFQTHNPIPTDA